jgi:hypothetical protein
MSTIEERLTVLEDERSIIGTLTDYAHGIDYGDEQLFIDCFTETAELSYEFEVASVRGDVGIPDMTFAGRDSLVEFFRNHTHAPALYHKHFLVEPRVRLKGDRATVASYYARIDESATGPVMSSFGRYIDEFVRCPDGRWRMESRRGQAEHRVPKMTLMPLRKPA